MIPFKPGYVLSWFPLTTNLTYLAGGFRASNLSAKNS